MKKLLLLIPIAILIIGCGGEEEVDYLPLSVGNEWEYSIAMTITTPDTIIEYTGTLNTVITEETVLINGTEVFEQVVTGTIGPMPYTDTSYIEETDDYVLEYENKTDTVPYDTTLALPLVQGNTWANYEVLGQEDVTVPVGIFNDCWEILETDNTDTTYFYLAADVGLVKMSGIETKADTTIEGSNELVSYTIVE